jgi:hypothetical protein
LFYNLREQDIVSKKQQNWLDHGYDFVDASGSDVSGADVFEDEWWDGVDDY